MKIKKKAALELSINTVVFLILGIALLGGGLYFTRTLFQKSDSGVASIMQSGDLDKKADSYNSLIIDREITIKSTESKPIEISFYCNKPSGDVCGGVSPAPELARPFFAEDTSNKIDMPAPGTGFACKGLDPEGNEAYLPITSFGGNYPPGISLSSVSTSVDANKNVGFKVILRSAVADAGRYNCNIIVAKSNADGTFIEGPAGEVYESKQVFITII